MWVSYMASESVLKEAAIKTTGQTLSLFQTWTRHFTKIPWGFPSTRCCPYPRGLTPPAVSASCLFRVVSWETHVFEEKIRMNSSGHNSGLTVRILTNFFSSTMSLIFYTKNLGS